MPLPLFIDLRDSDKNRCPFGAVSSFSECCPNSVLLPERFIASAFVQFASSVLLRVSSEFITQYSLL